MIAIYYRNADGEIYFCHETRGEHTMQKLLEMAENYNATDKQGRTAYVEELDDNSLTAYLFKKLQEKEERKKYEIDDCISQLEGVISFLEDLKGG